MLCQLTNNNTPCNNNNIPITMSKARQKIIRNTNLILSMIEFFRPVMSESRKFSLSPAKSTLITFTCRGSRISVPTSGIPREKAGMADCAEDLKQLKSFSWHFWIGGTVT